MKSQKDRSRVGGYLTALLAPALVAAVMQLSWPFFEQSPVSLFLIAVMLSSWYGGLGPGLLSTLVSLLLADYLFIQPYFSLWPPRKGDLVYLVALVAVGSFISLLSELMHRARQRAEAALESTSRAEASSRLVVEAAPSALLMVNEDGLITLINKQTERLFGYSREELLGQPVEMLVPERYRQHHPAHRQTFSHHPTTRAMGAGRDLYGQRKDGTEVPIEIGLNPIKTPEGSFVLASIIDITERKRNEERIHLVVEAAPNAMIMANDQGQITLVNRQTELLFGYARTELLGQPLEVLIPERYHAAHPGHRVGFFQKPSTRAMGVGRDLYGRRKDGTEVPIEIGLNPLKTPEGSFVLASIIDITERKRDEERLRLVVEAAPNAMIMANEQGQITLINKQTEQLFGYSRTELLGQLVEILLPQRYSAAHPEHRKGFFRDPSTRAMGAGRDLYGRRKDGTEVPIEIGLNPIKTPDGVFVLASIIDITARKQAEETLRRSQEQLTGLIGSAMDAIISVDEAQHIVLFNAAAERMFLFPAEDAIGQALDRFLPERFRPKHKEHIQDFGDTHVTRRSMGTLGPLYGLRADGQEFPIEASISQIESEGRKLFTVILRDITERQRAEAALKEQALMLDLAPVLIRDLNDRLIFWNSGAEQMYGWSSSEAMEKVSHHLLQTEFPRPLEEIKARLFVHGHWEGEMLQTRRNGQRIAVTSHWVLHKNENDQPKAILEVNTDITERKQAERALRESEERLQLAIESTKLGTWEFNPKTGERQWSGQCKAIFGFPQDANINNENVSERIYPEDRKRMNEILERALQPQYGGELHAQVRISVGPDQAERWIESRGRTIFEQGQAVRLIGTMLDITERKQAEEALLESEERLRLGLQAAHLGTWDYRFQTGDVFMDQRAYSNLGLSSGETTYDTTLERIHPDDRAAVNVRVQEALVGKNDGSYEQEFRVVWPDKSVHWLAAYGQVYFEGEGDSDHAVRYLGINMDISERKQAEETQRSSELRYRRLFESAKDGILILDADTGKIVDVNPYLIELLGSSKEELVGRELWEMGVFKDIVNSKLAFKELQHRGYIRYDDLPLQTEAGLIRQVEFVSNTYLAGETRVIQCNIRDITERKEAEREILRLNLELEQRVVDRTAQLQAANKELEAFSYSVSHDLRAPLRHINGFSQALLEDYAASLDETGKGYLQEVRGATQEMARLIDDVLELARVTRSEMHQELVDLSELACSVVAQLKKGDPGRAVTVEIEAGRTARGDKRLLKIVLTNLLGNAWKFTSRQQQAKISFGQIVQNHEIVYLVRDNGAGFDMAYEKKLFGAFQRLHAASDFEGTGIGLATVQRIINRHAGRVWAEGTVNEGAAFYFTLPNFKEARDGE
ncbi:MAG TPA: PAS domain S-box protein [Pyrinomonadaceae bacterium]|jgi:PAS domain S-box-containing protein|nr:PAS domain S-box protein [Pyrinomonadaceae bacterium]